MVRQISETDGVMIIENANSMTSTPTLAPGAPLRTLKVVKSQITSAMDSPRITTSQRAYLDAIRAQLSDRIIALTPVDETSAIGGIF